MFRPTRSLAAAALCFGLAASAGGAHIDYPDRIYCGQDPFMVYGQGPAAPSPGHYVEIHLCEHGNSNYVVSAGWDYILGPAGTENAFSAELELEGLKGDTVDHIANIYLYDIGPMGTYTTLAYETVVVETCFPGSP